MKWRNRIYSHALKFFCICCWYVNLLELYTVILHLFHTDVSAPRSSCGNLAQNNTGKDLKHSWLTNCLFTEKLIAVVMSDIVISDNTYFCPLSNQTHVTVPTSDFLLKHHHAFEHTVESAVLMSSCREEGFCSRLMWKIMC